MSAPGVPPSIQSRRQKRMGPAPFASFEDLSDELESPEDKQATGSVVRLPGIREDVTPGTPALKEYPSPEFVCPGISLVGASVGQTQMASLSTATPPGNKVSLQTPSTPRIDISRASSSSHHDSKDSSPERELFEGHDPCAAKLGLGFREEGTLDLRSSTEELDFQDPQIKAKAKLRSQSPGLHDDSLQSHQRKDSQSSDIVLLSISGRTSRLSSIGSQGSAHSRISNASHLSAISGQSGLSRSPSPHKMLLETSFCGTKHPTSAQKTSEQPGTKVETEVLEKVLLSRKHDPTKAILAEGITMEEGKSKTPPEKPHRKSEKRVQCVKSDITITVDKPPVSEVSDSNNMPKIPKTFVSASGVEYTYIPLKGPLPPDSNKSTAPTNLKIREIKSASVHSKSTPKQEVIAGKRKAKSATPSPIVQKRDDEPKYIRIKLKPDHLYDDGDSSSSYELQKPFTLNLNDTIKKPTQTFTEIIEKDTSVVKTVESFGQGSSLSNTPSASPKLSHRNVLKDVVNVSSKTPSPSLSRRSSFASLFKSRETIISPESPTIPGLKRKNTLTGIIRDAGDSIRERSRSRSKSRDRDKSSVMSAAPSSTESIDSNKSKQKSVFSIFKSKKGEKCKSEADSSSSEILPSIEGIANVEFKFNSDNNLPKRDNKSVYSSPYYEAPLEGNSIRIPLHSPSQDDIRSILQEVKSSSQDSQDTVIEYTPKAVESSEADVMTRDSESNITVKSSKTENSFRQSSTSSENVVFSTKLGSTNEIFTTKLPKEKHLKKNLTTTAELSQNEVAKTTQEEVVDYKVEEVTNKVEEIACKLKEVCKVEVRHETRSTTNEFDVEDKPAKKHESPSLDKAKTINSIMSSAVDEDHNSSESERDSEFEFFKKKRELDLKLEEKFSDAEPERKGLVLQQDNFEDELPYIPTTLPLERSVAIPIVPIKQRGTYEMKTCPIERPRSTTPINPSCLEEYCEEVMMSSVKVENITKAIEKIRISLPREESVERPHKVKSPRKVGSNTNWFEFAEKGISSQRRSSLSQEKETTPPPLPPKGMQKEWINFEEIPERRKPPKRIQTIPSRGTIEVPDSVLQDNVMYNYVNPEDCKCECHEISAREQRERDRKNQQRQDVVPVQEDELPLLEDEPVEEEKNVIDTVDRIKLDVTISDRRSTVSDSSVDLSSCIEQPGVNGMEQSLRTPPFTSDLGMSSNRSSVVSQDEPQSPESSPNAFPRPS